MSEKTAAEHDIGKLVADVQSLKRDLASLAEHSRGAIGSGASDAVNAIGDQAEQLYNGLAKQGRRQVKALSNQVEEQPLLSILIAFGVGFLGGRVLPR